MEIYNETITDLLNPDKNQKLRVRENIRGEVYVKDLGEVLVTCEEDIYSYLDAGELSRHFAATNMNERSSRSHTIFRLVIESTEKGSEAETEGQARCVRVSQLNLVDLAGSERAKSTGAEGIRLKEGGHINTSLMVLSKVIAKLSDPNVNVIPFRESKLTRILQSSLGGNAKTCVICTMTPAAIEESHSTLRFAKSAKMMKNKPIINEVMNDKAIISKYEKRIRKLERELEEKNQLESHVKLRDNEIMALRGQLVGSIRAVLPPGASPSKARRRETFFHGPQGLVPSPRNTFIKSRLTNESDKDGCAKKLFTLPAMVSDRESRDSCVDERESMERENSQLKSSLEREQAKNGKLKTDLKELEEMCTEMGDRMQDHIDEQQEQIDQFCCQVEDSENLGQHQKNKIQELETILIAAGEERQDLLNELEDNRIKIRQVEERNVLILNEAEEQRLDLESQISRLASENNLVSSPGKKRKSDQLPIGFNPEAVVKLKAEVDSKSVEIARLESLLRGYALETEEKLSALQKKYEEEAKRGQESTQQSLSGFEDKISQLEEEIRSLEEAAAQKNTEFSQMQRLIQEQTELVEIAAQQEITDLKTALEDSNTGRLELCTELEKLKRDHSTLLLKLQHTDETLETARIERQYEMEACPMESISDLEQLKQQLCVKESEIADLKKNKEVDVEMIEMLEQRDKMIANLRSQLEKTFSSQEDFERSRQDSNERISQLVNDVEQKSTELNDAEDRVIHLQLASVDAGLQIEQLGNDKKIADLKKTEKFEGEMREMLEQRDKMIGDLRSQLEKTFSSQEDFERSRQDSNERISQLVNDVEQKSTELNDAEDKLMHLQLSSVDAGLQIEKLGNDKNCMAKRNCDLSNQNSQLAQTILKLEKEKLVLEDISKSNEGNVVTIGDTSNDIHNATKFESLQAEISDLTGQNKRLLEESSVLCSRISELTTENEKLREKETADNPNPMIESPSSDLEQICNLKQQVSDLLENSARLSEQVQLLTQSNEGLSASKASLAERLDIVSEENVKMSEHYTAQFKEKNDLLAFANNEVTRLTAAVENWTEQNLKLGQESLVSSDVAHATLASSLEQQSEIQTLKQQIESFNHTFEITVSEHENNVKELNGQLLSAQDEITNMATVISNLTEEKSKLVIKSADLSESLANSTSSILKDSEENRKEILELEQQIKVLTEELARLNQRILEMTEKQSSTETSLLDATEEKDRLNSALETISLEAREADQRKAELQKRLQEMETKLVQSEKEVSIGKSCMAELTELIEEKDSELDAVKSKLGETDTSFSDSAKERDQLKVELETVSVRAKEAEQSLADYQQMLEEMETKLVQSKKEISIVKTCMSEFSELIEEKESELNTVKSKLYETEELLAASKEAQSEVESNLNQSKHSLSVILENGGDTTNLDAMQEQLNNRIAEISSLETKVKSLEVLLDSKSSESLELKNELKRHSDMINSLQANEVDEFALLEEKAILEEDICFLKEQLNCHVTEIKEIGIRLEEKNVCLVHFENQLNVKNTELLRMQTEYEEKLADLEKKNTDLNCRVAEELRAKNALRSDCDELMTSLQRKERAMKGKEEEQQALFQLEEELKVRDRDIAEKLVELQECVGHIEKTEEEKQELQKIISQMSAQMSQLEAEVLSLTEERDGYLQQTSNLNLQLEPLTDLKAQYDLKTEEMQTMKDEILTLIQGLSEENEKNKVLSDEAANLKSKIQSITGERDCQVQTISDLKSQLQEQVEKEAELSSKLSSVSNDLEDKTSFMGEYHSVSKELAEVKRLLEVKSESLRKSEEQIKELRSSKDAFSSRRKLLEDQMEELQKSILEYEMMKSSYIQLKSDFESLQYKNKLADAAKAEAEKDLSEYQHYHESTINTEKAKYQQLTEKYNELSERFRTETEQLKQEMVDHERELSTQISTLTSDRNHFALQVKEFSANLSNLNQEVVNLTENKDSLTARLKTESERCLKLEAKRIKDDKEYLDMYNKHQAMCNEADTIESKYNQLDTNFQSLKESLEKEIIRRKYVETVAKVNPKTYNPTTLEEFMKGLETDHTNYLNRIKNTYKDVGLVCQVCDKRRKIDPNSPRYVPRPPPDGAASAGVDRNVGRQRDASDENKATAVVVSPDLENSAPGHQVNPSEEAQNKRPLSPGQPQRKIALKKPKSSEDDCKQQ
ncbi:centromere-associated protein E-like isoform X2 [Bolinopsis microptera]